jgi:predicted dehydrogenase
MEKARVGIVGLYGQANRHYDQIEATPELELGAVCDIDERLAKAWSDKYGVPWYNDYADMVASDDCDYVLLTIPHGIHAEVACAAMEAGMPVLIQKPMVVRVSEADRIIETAQRTGTKVATYHTHYRSALDLKAVIEAGDIGEIMRADFTWHLSKSAAYYLSGPWRGTWEMEGSGLLSNQCIHMINKMQALAGPAAEVTSCTLANLEHAGIEVEDACIAAWRYANGAMGLFHVTSYTLPRWQHYEIVGNLGCVEVNDNEKRMGVFSFPLRDYLTNPYAHRMPRANLVDAPRPDVEWKDVPAVEPPESEMLLFARAVLEDGPILSPPEYALRDIETWNAMVLSHFRHKPVSIPVDRDEYDELFEELTEGQHSLHWG